MYLVYYKTRKISTFATFVKFLEANTIKHIYSFLSFSKFENEKAKGRETIGFSTFIRLI